jgi:hypothetical protein
MNALPAEQLIYTRVEPSYSPRGQGGFQTVWRSEDLSTAEIEEVERHIQCFRPAPEIQRLQFFQITSGRVVLARTVQVEAHSEIVDRHCREGAFLVHALLLDRSAFLSVDNNPFTVLDACPFEESPSILVEKHGRATDLIARASIEPAPSDVLADWPSPEACKLALLAMRAEDLRQRGRTVQFLGDGDEIAAALRLVFRLLRREWRLACSFNTYVEGCPLERGLYWAAGVARHERSDQPEVDARERRVLFNSGSGLAQVDLYTAWLSQVCVHSSLSKVLRQAESVEAFCRALEGGGPPERVPNPADLVEFVQLHRRAVAAQLLRCFEQCLRRAVAEALVNFSLECIDRARADALPVLLAASVQGDSQATALCRLAVLWLSTPPQPETDLGELQRLARQGRNRVLLHWASTLGDKPDLRGRDEALSLMTSSDFQLATQKLLNPIDPVHFVTPDHLLALLRDERLPSARDEDLIELIEAVLEADGGVHLGSLSNRIYEMQWGVDKIAKCMRKSNNVADGFRAAVEQCAPKLPLLRRIFR